MIREVIYKLVRKSTSFRKKKKKQSKSCLPPHSFHVRVPSRTPGFIIWFFLKRLVVIRSSSTFIRSPRSQFRLGLGYLLLRGYLKAWKTRGEKKPKEGEQESHVSSQGDKTMLALKSLGWCWCH